MDKIVGKRIKYAGEWKQNVFTLTKDIAIADTTISVALGSATTRAIESDHITLKIGSIRFHCVYESATTLRIVTSPVRTEVISKDSQVYVLEHLVAEYPEELVTQFELNRLQTIANSSASVLIADVSGKQTATYDLASINHQGPILFQILEQIGTQFELTTVDYSIESNALTWASITPIPSGVAILSFIPSKKIS